MKWQFSSTHRIQKAQIQFEQTERTKIDSLVDQLNGKLFHLKCVYRVKNMNKARLGQSEQPESRTFILHRTLSQFIAYWCRFDPIRLAAFLVVEHELQTENISNPNKPTHPPELNS